MMDLVDKLEWLSLGGLVGFILGYIVRSLREIKEKVDHMDDAVTAHDVSPTSHDATNETSKWDRDDAGRARLFTVQSLGMLLVIGLTVYAAFSTAKVNSELQFTLNCITNYNTHQSKALGLRDESVQAGTQSEIDLWTRYGTLYALAKKDPSKVPMAQEMLRKAIAAHRRALIDLRDTRDIYPYANPDVLANCEEESKQ